MLLQKELISQAVVAISPALNPFMFSQNWFLKHRFLDELEIQPESIFTKDVVTLHSERFQLLVVEGKIQFNCPKSDTMGLSVASSLGPMLEKLQDLPFIALGFNFNWVLFCEDETEFFNYGKLLFEKPDTALFSHFQDSNAAFGIFLSKAFEEGRLRLEARPAKFLQTSDGTERFGFTCDFNFHFDIDASANQELLMKRLSRFSICRKYSETIVDSI